MGRSVRVSAGMGSVIGILGGLGVRAVLAKYSRSPLVKFGDPLNRAHTTVMKLILLLTAIATMAHGQSVGSNYKLTRQTLTTSSAESVRTIRAILANHDARKLNGWDQETLKLYQQNDIRMLGRGTTIVVDKIDVTAGVIQFHLPGSQASKPLFAVLAADQKVKGDIQ
jgi:hypothetical protein